MCIMKKTVAIARIWQTVIDRNLLVFVIPAQAGDRRRLRSSYLNAFLIPACAGLTELRTFNDAIIIDN